MAITDHDLDLAEAGPIPALLASPTPPPVDLFGASASGARQRNEDRFLVASYGPVGELGGRRSPPPDRRRLSVAIVADGLGGLTSGRVAADAAVQAVFLNGLHLFHAAGPGEETTDLEVLRACIVAAHESVLRERRRHRARMSSTLTAALFDESRMTLGHVGDCRCYLLRGADLRLLTEDHAVGRENGNGAADVDALPGWAEVVTRTLGSEPSPPEIDLVQIDLVAGDKILLCSDGLSDTVDEERLRFELLCCVDAPSAAERLVMAAVDGGAADNATAVVALIR